MCHFQSNGWNIYNLFETFTYRNKIHNNTETKAMIIIAPHTEAVITILR